MAERLNYSAGNFEDIRRELFNFVKQYYPDLRNVSEPTVAGVLIDLNAKDCAGSSSSVQVCVGWSSALGGTDALQKRKHFDQHVVGRVHER